VPVLEIPLPVFLAIPVAAGVAGLVASPRAARWLALAAAAGTFAYTLFMLADFAPAGAGLRYVTDEPWIPELGIRFSLGVDGLSLFLVTLTALLWLAATIAAVFRRPDRAFARPRAFFFHMGLAESAVLGAFLAQDLALFVAFFDLMLVPFYFLIGQWGGRERVAATTKFVIYTLVGSLLMLAAAVALGVLATPDGGRISFALPELAQRSLPEGAQVPIFLAFAAAFLVKAPSFPFHGWLPDAYRAAPLPVLALLSAVLSKVGVYGFLRIVLPVLPDASVALQELMLVIAVFSILYGSVLAFSQDDARLVVGFSSIAQLGFITLGIFALDDKGAQGAVLQMVTHGLAAAALFLIIGVLAARAGGSDSLGRMGGIALRAPVLAALFLIIAFATLAMPGSPNFAGELLILFGTFEDKIVYGLVASVGVVLAAVYAIRLFQRAMHNRAGPDVASRDIGRADLAAIAPLVAVIVVLGLDPQLVLGRTGIDTASRIQEARELAGGVGEAQARPAPGVTPGGATVPGEPPVRSPSRPAGEPAP
jgi:NADH-quinone oxidoreductase subunit M